MQPTHLLSSFLSDMPAFVRQASGIRLRPYQLAPIDRLKDSILNHYGDTLILVFPRQSGKDEFIIQLMAYLLNFYSGFPLSMVVVNPTYKPQTLNALLRFDQVLSRNPLTSKRWKKHGDFMRLLDESRISFLSGNSRSNVVGATASLLLIINEAQDISPALYQRRFLPMAASTNATRLLAGTLWTSSTLLSREIRHAQYSEGQDGRQRLFMVDADQVRRVLPNYGAHVDSVVSRWGRQHPLVKTQYFNEEIDASTGMFNAARLALIFNSPPKIASSRCSSGVEFGGTLHPVYSGCTRGVAEHPIHAFLIDLAGQDEATMNNPGSVLSNPSRDSTTLSVAGIDLSTVPTLNFPAYRIIHRQSWTGENHLTIFGQIRALAESWQPCYLVIDATGVGEGLWALLDKAFPAKVIPVRFTAGVKSEIGYRFLAMINTGRFCVSFPHPGVEAQYRLCQSEVLPGPGKTLRWGVPEGARDADGALIHDDYLMADSLVTQLDKLDWSLHAPATIINPAPFSINHPDIDLLEPFDFNF